MFCTHCSAEISEHAEICPKCGVKTFTVHHHCYNCGDKVNANQEICISCGVTLRKKPLKSQNSTNVHPAVPPILSFLLTGLGQVVNGQVAKGIALLAISIFVAIFTLGISAIITTPLAIIDAYLIGKKKADGKNVDDWEFF